MTSISARRRRLRSELLGLVDGDRHEPRSEVARAVDLAELLPGDEPRGLDGLVRDGVIAAMT